MRLIDADFLKEKLDELEPYIDCDENSTTWIESDEVYNAIDNAPIVEPEKAKESETIKAYTKGFDTGVETVKNERPQGEWNYIQTGMNNDLISHSEAEKLGATCLARRNENGQLEAIISLDNAPTVESDYARGFIDALDKAFTKFDANCIYNGDSVLQKLEKLKVEKGGAE